jgi:divalent metal cation (Fe/Co/Zn/Cd) transporter
VQGYYILDPILGVVIAGVIARSGFMILRKTIPILVDEAWLFPADIEAVLADLPQVRGFSDLRSRQVHDERFLEMSVQFATDSLREAHELSHKIEERIIARYGLAQVTIHVEPE